MTEAYASNYWISPTALYITLNALGMPNYIQANTAGGSVIMCHVPEIIGYDDGHNYRRWQLIASPTLFNSNSEKYVYVQIPRDMSKTTAMVVFPSEHIDLYGKNEAQQQIGSADYYYIWLQAKITATNGTSQRTWDGTVNHGTLSTDEAYATQQSEWFKWDAVTQMVTFVKTVFSATINYLTIGKELIFGDGDDQKKVTQIADGTDMTDDSAEHIATPAFVTAFGNSHFLRKDQEDTTNYLLNLLGGIKFNSPYGITAAGAATFKSLMAEDGTFTNNLITKNLTVTGMAHFFELVIDKISSIGGAVILTPANGFTVSDVAEGNDSYTLYYVASDADGNGITNDWKVGDQALCQSFNATTGVSHNVSNKLYWCKVTAVSSEVTERTIGGHQAECHSITISKTQKLANCTVNPEVGDNIVMLGYQGTDDPDRQSALYLSAYNSIDGGYIDETTGKVLPALKAPFMAQYKGINDFDLAKHRKSYYDATGAHIIGSLTVEGDSGETPLDEYIHDNRWEMGRNLLTGTNKGSSLWWYTVGDGSVSKEDDTAYGVHFNVESIGTSWHVMGFNIADTQTALLKPNTKYCLSFDAMVDVSGKSSAVYIRQTAGANLLTSGSPVISFGDADVWKRTSVVLTTNNFSAKGLSFANQTIYMNIPCAGNFRFRNIKLEEGEEDTGYCLAEEDKIGADGKKGTDAVEFIINPSPISFTTGSDGKVASGKSVSVKAMKGGTQVAIASLTQGTHVKCTVSNSASSGNTRTFTLTVSGYTSIDGISGTYNLAPTSGMAVFTAVVDGVSYPLNIPFSVDVKAVFNKFSADVNAFKSTYDAFTNGVDGTLVENFSKIEQDAKKISLEVAEGAVGRRNMLDDSAFERPEHGWKLRGSGARVEMLNGFNGSNVVYSTCTKSSYGGVAWGRQLGNSNNLLVKANTKYTFSVWFKANSNNVRPVIEFPYHDSADGSKRTQYASKSFTYSSKDKWELLTYTLLRTEDTYVEANFIAYAHNEGETIDVYFARPMLEEAEEYKGWTRSQQDYDYIGGNLLPGTQSLSENVYGVKNMSKITANQYGDCYGIVEPISIFYDTKTSVALEVDTDYMLSFMAGGAGVIGSYIVTGSTLMGFIETSLGASGELSNNSGLTITTISEWKRYWIHFRTPSSVSDTKIMLAQLSGSITFAQPKLEKGTRLTEWTDKRDDMVSKSDLKASGIDITARKIIAYTDQFVVAADATGDNPFMTVDKKGVHGNNMYIQGEISGSEIKGNNDSFLIDETGNARFGVVGGKRIELQSTARRMLVTNDQGEQTEISGDRANAGEIIPSVSSANFVKGSTTGLSDSGSTTSGRLNVDAMTTPLELVIENDFTVSNACVLNVVFANYTSINLSMSNTLQGRLYAVGYVVVQKKNGGTYEDYDTRVITSAVLLPGEGSKTSQGFDSMKCSLSSGTFRIISRLFYKVQVESYTSYGEWTVGLAAERKTISTSVDSYFGKIIGNGLAFVKGSGQYFLSLFDKASQNLQWAIRNPKTGLRLTDNKGIEGVVGNTIGWNGTWAKQPIVIYAGKITRNGSTYTKTSLSYLGSEPNVEKYSSETNSYLLNNFHNSIDLAKCIVTVTPLTDDTYYVSVSEKAVVIRTGATSINVEIKQYS